MRVSCFEFQPETARAPRPWIFLSSLQERFFTSLLSGRGWLAGFVALAVIVLSPVSGAGQVEKIPALLAKPKVLCGRFEQTKHLAGLKKPLVSNGRFCVVADKGVLWRTLQPFPNTVRLTRDEVVQSQGERVIMRLNAKQEPTVRLMNSVLFSLLAGDFGQLEKFFDLAGSVNKNGWSVTLKPRESGLAKALGAISVEGSSYVTNISIDEANGDRTRIVFSAIETGDHVMSYDEAALF